MSFFIAYPDDWIGVPDFGDGEMFAAPIDWAAALVAELAADAGTEFTGEQRSSLVEALSLLATGVREERGADSAYIWLASLHGPVRVVDVRAISRRAAGDASAADLAGQGDPGLLREPRVEEFVSDFGVRGVAVEGYVPLDEAASHVVIVRAAHVLESEDGFLQLVSSSTDLAGFEQFRPHFARLAHRVSWGEQPAV